MSDQKLTGDDLTEALTVRGLPDEGSADDKRAAIEAYDSENAFVPESEAVKVYHPDPSIQSIQTVAQRDLADWQDQGWLTNPPKTTNA